MAFPADPSSSPERSPTTREIAKRAGLSSTAVSLALRNHPKIPAATRERVQRIAAELGYRPDPQVAKLMQHLQQRRKPQFQSVICGLTSIPDGEEPGYTAEIIASARRRADAHGYGFELIHVPDTEAWPHGLGRSLRARGVEGVLLLPFRSPRDVTAQFPWGEFSVVSATYGVLAPEFHRVVPHQFGNTLVLCGELARRGFHRIGLVLPMSHDLTVHHGFSAAVAWQNLLGGTELVHPLIKAALAPEEIARWFKREKPDVIIAPGENDSARIAAAIGVTIPGPIAFAVTDRFGDSVFAGIDERPSEIGSAAIDLLHSKILTGERGVPTTPMVAMIAGRWVAGPSAERATTVLR